MEYKPYAHAIFLDEVNELMEVGFTFEEASQFVYLNLLNANETNLPDYKSFLSLKVPNCAHCEEQNLKVV